MGHDPGHDDGAGQIPAVQGSRLRRDGAVNPVNFGDPRQEGAAKPADRRGILAASRETGLPCMGSIFSGVAHLSPTPSNQREKGRQLLEQSVRNCHAYGGDTVLAGPRRVEPPGFDPRRRLEPIHRANSQGVARGKPAWACGFSSKPSGTASARSPSDCATIWTKSTAHGLVSILTSAMCGKFAPSEDWIRTLGTRIVKLDVKDWSKARGCAKSATMKSTGRPCATALAEINYNGWATAEVKPGHRDRLADVARRMDRVLEIR